jgi:hypothetical protein
MPPSFEPSSAAGLRRGLGQPIAECKTAPEALTRFGGRKPYRVERFGYAEATESWPRISPPGFLSVCTLT